MADRLDSAVKPPFPASLDELEERVLAWGTATRGVRAIMIIGSRARTDRPADEWADTDFAIAVRDPERYMRERSWVREIGDQAAAFRDPNPSGATLHVLFRSGVIADFGFVPTAPFRRAIMSVRGEVLRGAELPDPLTH